MTAPAFARAAPSYDDPVEENAWLRGQLGVEIAAERVARLMTAFGVMRAHAQLLLLLHGRRGRVATWDFLEEWLPTKSRERQTTEVVKVHTCRLRARMGPGVTETVWGVGVRLSAAWIARLDVLFEGMD